MKEIREAHSRFLIMRLLDQNRVTMKDCEVLEKAGRKFIISVDRFGRTIVLR